MAHYLVEYTVIAKDEAEFDALESRGLKLWATTVTAIAGTASIRAPSFTEYMPTRVPVNC